MDEKEKLKNINDLNYTRLLNWENIIFWIFGGAIIATAFADKIPGNLNRGGLIFLLSLFLIITFNVNNKKVNKILKDITKI